MDGIIILVYGVLAYLAMKKLWWSKHTYIIIDPFKTFAGRIIVAFCTGFIVIPIAAVVMIIEHMSKKG